MAATEPLEAGISASQVREAGDVRVNWKEAFRRSAFKVHSGEVECL